MKPNLTMLVSVVVGLTITSIGCAPPTGACTSMAGMDDGCITNTTAGNCENILAGTGTFHEGLSCEDLGFRTTNDGENTIVGGITGIS